MTEKTEFKKFLNYTDRVANLFREGTGMLFDAYKFMNISYQRYLLLYVLPVLLLPITALTIGEILLPILIANIIAIIGVMGVVTVLFYPVMKYSSYRNKIDSEFPTFLTHITALSMSNTNRIEVFKAVSQSDEYDAITTEVEKFLHQIELLNSSMDKAALSRANETPSDVMVDFYEKMAYSISSGQTLNEFLIQEQENVMNQYEADYISKIEKIKFVSRIFIGLVTGFMFIIVVASITPFLFGFNGTITIVSSLAMYLILILIFIFVINSISPKDNLWYFSDEINTRKELLIKGSLVVTLITTPLIGIILLVINPNSIPNLLYPVVSVIPLMIPSFLIYSYEKQIIGVENQFNSFIQSLGSLEAKKQTSTKNILKDIKTKDFGRLNKHISKLYNRLYIVVLPNKSWNHFSASIGSNLIKKYSSMYSVGRQLGVNTKVLGDIISSNYSKMTELRNRKTVSISNLKSNLIGTSLVLVFILVFISNLIKEVSNLVPDTGGSVGVNIIQTGVYDFFIIDVAVYIAIIVNGIIVSILIRKAERRYIGGSVMYFTIYIIIAFTLAYGLNQTQLTSLTSS